MRGKRVDADDARTGRDIDGEGEFPDEGEAIGGREFDIAALGR
jgi:hypothetical protein